MATESQPPTKQLISQNAYIVWLRWPSPKVLSLTFRKGNDKYFPKHCRHFRCRKSLYTDLLPQTNKSGRLLLLPCSCNSYPRRRAFLLLHQNLVRDRGRHRGKGHTPIKLLAKTVQCSDVCCDCRASLLGRHIFNQVFLPLLLPGSREYVVQNGSLVVGYFCGTGTDCGHLNRGNVHRLCTYRLIHTRYARPLTIQNTLLIKLKEMAFPVQHFCAVSTASCTTQWW